MILPLIAFLYSLVGQTQSAFHNLSIMAWPHHNAHLAPKET